MDLGRIDELIRKTQEGDLDAFEAVVHSFEWPVRAWIVSRCPPGGDADEVAQLTFLEAFRQIGKYSPGTDFRAWLFTIARYQLMAECLRLRRTADYRSRYGPYALTLELERRAAEEAPEGDGRLEHLRDCVAGLDDRARTALDLRYQASLSLEEISQRIGRTVAGTKKYLFLLRKKLHDCVQQRLSAEGADGTPI